MKHVKQLHPNRIYCNDNGLVIYTIKGRSESSDSVAMQKIHSDGAYLSIILSPILSLLGDSEHLIDIFGILPRIKFTTAYPATGWVEAKLPRRSTVRLFIALDAIANFFSSITNEMDVHVASVCYESGDKKKWKLKRTDLDTRTLEVMDDKARNLMSIRRNNYHHHVFFDNEMSYAFESDDDKEQFAKYITEFESCYFVE